MKTLLVLPVILQIMAMSVDELLFHRQRGLPRWERIGHPLDTLTAVLCYGWLVLTPVTASQALNVYVGLAAFSCLFITKDELVHARLCDPKETWLHAVLFVLHPVVFFVFGVLWYFGIDTWLVSAELLLTLAFFLYQVIYWSLQWQRPSPNSRA